MECRACWRDIQTVPVFLENEQLELNCGACETESIVRRAAAFPN